MSDVNWLQATAGTVLGLVFGTIFSDPLKRLLSLAVNFFANLHVRKLDGRWKTTYWYRNDNDEKIIHEDVIVLKQLGKYVSGKNEGDSNHRYTMTGQLYNGIFYTGTWQSIRPETTFHGAFQLVVLHNGQRIKGKWLGFDNPDIVNHGEWEWKRLD